MTTADIRPCFPCKERQWAMQARTFVWSAMPGYRGWIDRTIPWRRRRYSTFFGFMVTDEHGPYIFTNCPFCGGELTEPFLSGEGDE